MAKYKHLGYVFPALTVFGSFLLMSNGASALTLTENYTLEEDITDGIVVEAGSQVILNLNGHDITNTAAGKAAIINRGTLVIEDVGNPNRTGTVSTNQSNTAAVTNYPNATITISGGTYTSDKWYIIRNYGEMTINSGATVTANAATTSNASMVTNGWVGSNDSNNGAGITANSGTSEPHLTINGGTFTAGLSNCSVIKNDDYSNLVINGGTFRQPNGSLADCDSVILNWNVAEIKGGNFFSENGPVVSNGAYTANSDKGLITISGGTFTIGQNGAVLGYGNDGWNNGTGRMVINGGTFSTAVSALPVNPRSSDDGKFYDLVVEGGFFGSKFVDTTVIGEGFVSVLVDEEEGLYEVQSLETIEESGHEIERNEAGDNVVYPTRVDYDATNGGEPLYSDGTVDGYYAGNIVFKQEFIADRKAYLVISDSLIDKDSVTISQEGGKNELLGLVYISVNDRDGHVIPVNNNEVRVSIEIDEATYEELKEKYDSFAMAYFEAGEEVERFAAELVKDEDGTEVKYYVVFTTTHFSTFGLVGINEPEAPDTGVITRESGSAMGAALVTAIAVGVTAAIFSFVVLARRLLAKED